MTAPLLRVLVVDDEPDVRLGLERLVQSLTAPDHVRAAGNGEDAARICREFLPHVVVADVNMPGMTGMELLRHIKAHHPGTEVVLITGYATIPLAVEAMQSGTAHFLSKPFDNAEFVDVVRRSGELATARERPQDREESDADAPVAGSPAMRHVMELVDRVAPTDANVLLVGESGTGKEVISRTIHRRSKRHNRPFIPVNTAALPEALLESELFGHKKGAFTGATGNRLGIFREADGGTVFLDEVALMPVAFQGKLLRVLQERVVIPLGTSAPVPVDFRLIAATNRDLQAMTEAGEFREDLYYRLNVLTITVPPLRERREDIPELATRLLERYGKEARLTPAAVRELTRLPWAGNVRELENCIQRALILAGDSGVVVPELLMPNTGSGWPAAASTLATAEPSGGGEADCADADAGGMPDYEEAKKRVVESFQRQFIERALTRASGNLTHAAQMCGLTRAAFRRIMNALGVRRQDFIDDKM